MKISIAMTTYKSKCFIGEQLESIFNQTRLPEEIIICDDASPDDTVLELKRIIANSPESIDIKIIENEKNLGFAKNFEQCFMLCSGDIIFPCDADDIWENSKIEIMASVFEKNEDAVMAFHDAIIINGEGEVIGESLNAGWDVRDNKADIEGLLDLAIRRRGVPYGLTSAFRRELVEFSVPFVAGVGHDEWLAYCAPLLGNIITVSDKLARYRRHGNNTSNNRPSIYKRIIKWNREAWFTHGAEIRNVFESYLKRYGSYIPDTIKNECTSQ